MPIKVLYTLCLALLVALFVGSGIAAFYPAPERPTYPSEDVSFRIRSGPDGPTKAEERKMQLAERRYQREQKDFERASAPYNRNVSIIALTAAVLILTISLTLAKRILLLSDGLLLGGALTLVYSIIRGFMGENDMLRFIVVAVGTAVTLVIGYLRFVKTADA